MVFVLQFVRNFFLDFLNAGKHHSSLVCHLFQSILCSLFSFALYRFISFNYELVKILELPNNILSELYFKTRNCISYKEKLFVTNIVQLNHLCFLFLCGRLSDNISEQDQEIKTDIWYKQSYDGKNGRAHTTNS